MGSGYNTSSPSQYVMRYIIVQFATGGPVENEQANTLLGSLGFTETVMIDTNRIRHAIFGKEAWEKSPGNLDNINEAERLALELRNDSKVFYTNEFEKREEWEWRTATDTTAIPEIEISLKEPATPEDFAAWAKNYNLTLLEYTQSNSTVANYELKVPYGDEAQWVCYFQTLNHPLIKNATLIVD
jgi:hypothetical protein